MKRHCFLLGLVFLVAAVSAAGPGLGGGGDLVGGWGPINNLTDPHVVEIGKFAVREYNKRSKTNLELKSIVKGESQVVAGTNYKLVLAVSGGDSKKYEAVVWEKPWEKFRELTSFKPVRG
ncbi:cysteine proteinase inhibitor 5 [Ricinus communis]|uniref:Cysteine proteinase inhibitor, putative n=1 Tax=Ricinus communis TaxID=3988 RepID=B9SYV2_RICCO|nr:cysteine proteinase inhibitor 5 [Ricinus communis]EEF31214.1 Cysteine proteinase inhibitor, putative [Ricinus communis]|eukprot:XP_002531171.1 cysteine proteinase inhibitor 5 [Ricinus communis]